jgi:hypothetical protein
VTLINSQNSQVIHLSDTYSIPLTL